MSLDGYKTMSHEFLVGYIAKYYKELSTSEIFIIDQLRKARNDIAYRGDMISSEYLERNREGFLSVINKLEKIVENKMIN